MKKEIAPVTIIFIVVNCLAIVFRKKFEENGIDTRVLLGGNLIIFITTVASTYLYLRALATKNPQAVVRGVYGGFMLKFFVMLMAALIYIATVKPINRPALFGCLGLYLVYHFVGIQNVLRQKKKSTDAKNNAIL